MAVKSMSIDFAARGVLTIALHPGSVRTETREGGQVDVSDSVTGMRQVLAALTPEQSGSFARYDGGTIEW